jgi:uncharacterized membrane protein
MDEKLHKAVARVLGFGITFAIISFVVGFIIAFLIEKNFDALNFDYSFSNILKDLVAIKSKAFFELGSLTIIITPFARTFAACVYFLKEKNLKYFVISALIILMLSASALISLFFSFDIA